MPIDNELYNHLSATWWDETEALGILRTWFNPVRFNYFRRILTSASQPDPRGLTLLDVGCGGGLLAEEFAGLGCQVTGLDPSEASLDTAREHARQAGLEIAYQSGVGEHLPFADASFDIVICCDVLEHVNDLEQVIKEIARVLKPGGHFFYDTINRTFFAWFADIQVAQVWKITRFMPRDLHDWRKFIKPQELLRCLQKCQLQHREMKGISPRANPFVSFLLFLQHKQGKITLTTMGKRLAFHESKDLIGSYMGYALK
jgi:2-polyprenyl-6-hydroxyphenyl methylase / 3-demethylubiquinone-9 3-methyltransferase